MSTTHKIKFPPKEGWLTAEFTMKSKQPLSEEEIKQMASFGRPNKYEWGLVEQYGAKVKVIMREIKLERMR